MIEPTPELRALFEELAKAQRKALKAKSDIDAITKKIRDIGGNGPYEIDGVSHVIITGKNRFFFRSPKKSRTVKIS